MFLENLSIATKLINGLGLAIVGMGVVFTALALISVALDVLRITSAQLENQNRPSTTAKDKTGTTVAKPSLEAENELIAVITAAVTVSSGTTNKDFIVRSIRPRQHEGSIWSPAGRRQQMKTRIKLLNSKGFRG